MEKTFNSFTKISYDIIGIISNFEDYKMAWSLNQLLNINFTKILNNYSNNLALYKTILLKKEILLIENKNESEILIDELKKFNFLIKIYDYELIEKKVKEKFVSTKEFIFSGKIDKLKLTKKSIKIINEIV